MTSQGHPKLIQVMTKGMVRLEDVKYPLTSSILTYLCHFV